MFRWSRWGLGSKIERLITLLLMQHREEMAKMAKLDDAIAKVQKAVDDVAVRVQALVDAGASQEQLDVLDAAAVKLDGILPAPPA